MAKLPAPSEGIALTHFIVSDDIERSRRFYTKVLGGEVVLDGEPTIVALANSWVIINRGGGPTDDKPTVTLETPSDPDRVSSFLNIRVADIEAVHADWSARGAEFLTPPMDRGREVRCYVRDPDSHLIEVGQATGVQSPGAGETGWEWPARLDALAAAPANHILLLENERVRVLETVIPVASMTAVHTHRWPSVEYVVSASSLIRRDGDGNVLFDSREAQAELEPSEVLWSGPFPPHSVENVGDAELRVLMVEVKAL
ncbi:MAG TPA: VOC family protein [Solirubrobacteraceae bacterium]|nr:VOC family protein [Solirubrobacteraceae bacterium]